MLRDNKEKQDLYLILLMKSLIVKRCCTFIINSCYNAKHSHNFDPELRNDSKRTNW